MAPVNRPQGNLYDAVQTVAEALEAEAKASLARRAGENDGA